MDAVLLSIKRSGGRNKVRVLPRPDAGISVSAVTREFNATRQTILRVKLPAHQLVNVDLNATPEK